MGKKIITALRLEGFFNFVSLNEKIRYTLGRQERLKSRKAIEILFKEGKSFSVFPFRVLYKLEQVNILKDTISDKNGNTRLQAAFTVSSRNFKKAVDRNRIKRLMREAYRLQKNDLQQLPVLNILHPVHPKLVHEKISGVGTNLSPASVGADTDRNQEQPLRMHPIHLNLFFIFVGKEIPEYKQVFEKTGIVLKRMLNIIDDRG